MVTTQSGGVLRALTGLFLVPSGISPPSSEQAFDQRPAPLVVLAQDAQLRVTAAEESLLIKRAEGFLKMFDVVAARLVLQDLARRGSAQGALLLAKTFDPDFALVWKLGSQVNREEAARWYRRSADLGSPEAATALGKFTQR
jgi:TPR repeat protein